MDGIQISNRKQAVLLPASNYLHSVAKWVSLLFFYFIKFGIFSRIQIWWALDFLLLVITLVIIIKSIIILVGTSVLTSSLL